MDTVKLSKDIKIEQACSKDPTRFVLNRPYLEIKDGQPARLVATNGKIAAIVPVIIEAGDLPGPLDIGALKESRKMKLESPSIPLGAGVSRADVGTFPNVDCVIPKEPAQHTFALDPELLYQLAQAIGADRGVILEYIGPGKALRVRPCINPHALTPKGNTAKYRPACPEALGVIMPLNLPE